MVLSAELGTVGSAADTAYSNVQDAVDQVARLISSWSDDSTSPQVTVNTAQGTCYMTTYLFVTGAHSGARDRPTIWKGDDNVILSGESKGDNWTQVSGSDVWSAPVPLLSETRSLYVDGASALGATTEMIYHNTYTVESHATNASFVNVPDISGIERVELRYVGIFTDRYTAVDYVAEVGQTLVTKQAAWYRDLIGYDVVAVPELLGFNFGYQEPEHDVEFHHITWAHTTWNYPSSKYAYADQQTGAYLGNFSTFEAARPFWFMTPGAVQISVAECIKFVGGGVHCTGASMGIGNDANAHLSEIV